LGHVLQGEEMKAEAGVVKDLAEVGCSEVIESERCFKEIVCDRVRGEDVETFLKMHLSLGRPG
jgi:hypothetical protein